MRELSVGGILSSREMVSSIQPKTSLASLTSLLASSVHNLASRQSLADIAVDSGTSRVGNRKIGPSRDFFLNPGERDFHKPLEDRDFAPYACWTTGENRTETGMKSDQNRYEIGPKPDRNRTVLQGAMSAECSHP